ncbi:MAG: (Fe-S)-binding protein, partial [bacterium]
LVDYAASHPANGPRPDMTDAQLATQFTPDARWVDEVPETEIRRILNLTGKTSPEEELNCGACGYITCRDKAIAVMRGMAEVEMCIPYMRRLAEQRRDRIIETSPNGIVIVDEHLTILNMNPAFRKFFMCSDAVCGKPISYLMDPEPFEQVATGREDKLETVVIHDKYALTCHQIIYSLPEDRQYVGIFINITHSRESQHKLNEMRAQTVRQAQDLLHHQITMAQNIAKFLGESTAHGEKLVENLRRIAQNEPQKK